ncbi:MAG: RagB/SusD family nutrient uptake outer membrane protein [Bacteroidales bacterium]
MKKMKNMKKIKIIIKFIVLVLFLNACSESFLDISSETDLTIDIYYKSQSDFELALNGAYEPLRLVYNKRGYFSAGESRSDNAYYDYNADNRGQIDHEFVADFTNDATNGDPDDKFYDNYSVIARVNQILATIDNEDVEFKAQDVKDNIKGQALFLRALSYFHLVQYFGSVPLHLKPARNLKETALPLSSVDAVYLQIIQDAKDAIPLLPLKADQGVGRATKGAAQTLLGNVYVVQKNWTDAVTILNEVVLSKQYKLITTGFADIFDPANKNNDESVFEVQFLGSDARTYSSFPYILMPASMNVADVAAVTGVSKAESRNGEGIIPAPDLISAYDTSDLRLDATIGYAVSVPNGADTILPYAKKFMFPGTHPQHGRTNNNFPVYRYSEVLLLLAEALNESGSSALALPYLNEVRDRADLDDILTTDQSALREIILNERRLELAFEGKRWLDLVRTGKADVVMKAFGANVKADPQKYYFPQGISPLPAAYTNIETLFPIPASEEALNPHY